MFIDTIGSTPLKRRIHKNQKNRNFFSFLDDLDRICEEGYRPTDQDILRIRVATTGIVKITFEINKIDFK